MKALLKRRLLDAGRYSLLGLLAAWRSEEAIRVEAVLFCLLAPAAFWIGDNAVEVCLLIASLVFVIVVELLNTALEKTIDRISTERHETSRFVKDVGSAAVAVSMVQVVVIWALILLMN
ncbi:MAG: diacylglycerol kinase [Quisquiliibacterium sp.]